MLSSNGGRMDFQLATEYFKHHNSLVPMTWEKGEPTIGKIYSEYLEQRLGKVAQESQGLSARVKSEPRAAIEVARRLLAEITEVEAKASGDGTSEQV